MAITGLLRQGELLSANTETVVDADGLGKFSYQWYAGGVAITEATGDVYKLTASEVGKTLTVSISYADGHQTRETMTSPVTTRILPPAGTGVNLSGKISFWKSDAAISGVASTVSGNGQTISGMTTGVDGLYSHLELLAASYGVESSKTVDASVTNAVKANDALAALKIAVGLSPNSDGSEVSNYQLLAADVNRDGKVNASDALAILKMAVQLSTAPANEWLFVPESIAAESMNRTNVGWSSIPSNVSVTADMHVDIVGIVKGDVNGSWSA